MTDTEKELLEKLKALGVQLRFKLFFQRKNTSWIENGVIVWENPPTLLCEEGDKDVAQFILKRIKPSRKQWATIRRTKNRIVSTKTIKPKSNSAITQALWRLYRS